MIEWLSMWSIITVVVCAAGAIITLGLAQRFSRDDDLMQVRLSGVFWTETAIYVITGAFGVCTFLGIEMDWLLYPLRVLFIISAIYFARRLVAPIGGK